MADGYRHALIEGDSVVNVVVLDKIYAGVTPDSYPSTIIAVHTDNGGPGWRYTNGEFIAPIPPALPPRHITEAPMWAVRTVLQDKNLFDRAETIINASDNNALKNVWSYGNHALRNSPAIISLGAQLGLNDSAIDALFVEAHELEI